MTSVPLPYVDNLSSLAWIGICIFILTANIITHKYAVIGIMIMLGIFVLDQLVLGPIWYMKRR